MFRLTKEEALTLVSQNVIPLKRSFGGYLPYAFTEQGVAMLSSILKSKRAIHVNIAIMRAFVRLRQILSTYRKFANKLNQLYERYTSLCPKKSQNDKLDFMWINSRLRVFLF